MDDAKTDGDTPTIGAVDLSAMMAKAIVEAVQGSQGGMMDVGLTMAALSKASAMVMGTIRAKGHRLAMVQRYRLQVGLDTEEVAAMIARLPEEDKPAIVDVAAIGGVN